MTQTYQKLLAQHQAQLKSQKTKYNTIAIIRLILILAFCYLVYAFFKHENSLYLYAAIAALVGFFAVLRVHLKVSWDKKIEESLIDINQAEIDFVEHGQLPEFNGKVFIDHAHTYTQDLDLFGENSLYQYLNRVATQVGKNKLASRISNLLNKEEILLNQAAVKELTPEIEWRQKVLAIAQNIEDNPKQFAQIKNWVETDIEPLPKHINFLSYLLPVAFLVSACIWYFNPSGLMEQVLTGIFVINVMATFSQMKRIKKILISSDKTNEILKRYGLIITEIENKSLQSERLKTLQAQLNNNTASREIDRLSSLLGQMENILNIVSSVIFNGLSLYHIHIYRRLLAWKESHQSEVLQWLDVIGEFETLNSLANFTYNNPEYVFPEIYQNDQFNFKELGHPMINGKNRVNNNISFDSQPFVILTGSNMSGKSTFLRTVGVNLVLGQIGSVVCAQQASIPTLPLLVSMRVSDSLSENESYFFAEVKRLKQLSEIARKQPCFVLLDEILRGTNSDDKRKGTKEFIKRIMSTNSYGIIATHDLDVCNLTNDYPHYLTNQHFEVDIVNNELYFDYKIREGICQNQSATFLMKKLDIID